MSRNQPHLPLMPKCEQLQRIAAHLPQLRLDVPTLWAYLALVSVAGEITAASDEFFARHGLSEGRLVTLSILYEYHPKALAPSELAELSGVTRGTITGLLDGLERDGHVKRRASGDDRRVTPVTLTPAGRKLAASVLEERTSRIQTLMRNLSASERDTLISLLVKLREGLGAFRKE